MAEVAAKQRKHKMSRLEKKNTLIAYSFLAPNFLGFAIFTLVPVVCAILLAFVEWNGGDISNAHFVGLQNFAEIFKADKVASKWANGDYLYFFNRVDLGIALKNTVFYALINVPLTLVCAIALALALNKAKGAVAFRTIFFFPYVASMVAICVCWNFMLMKDGPVNQMIMALGINFNNRGQRTRRWRCGRLSLSACGAQWATTWSSTSLRCKAFRANSTKRRRWTARTSGSSSAM